MQEAQSYQAVFTLTSDNIFYYSQWNVVFKSEPCSVHSYISLLPTVHPMLVVTQQYCPFHFAGLISPWSVPSTKTVLSLLQEDYSTTAEHTEAKVGRDLWRSPGPTALWKQGLRLD